MKLKAVIGALALSTLVMSGAALAQDASSGAAAGPGTMAPIPNPPDTHKASHHGKHMKKHAKHHAKKHHAAKKADAAPAAAAQ